MKEKEYYHSFASRLSRWVILALLIMMGGLSALIYWLSKGALVEVNGQIFRVGMRSTDKVINLVMADVAATVRNNLFEIERHLKEPDQMLAIAERIAAQNPSIRSCDISFVDDNTQVRDSAYWSEPFLDTLDAKTPLVAYRYPIQDPQGRIVAIMRADLPINVITQVLQEQDSIFEKESWTAPGQIQTYLLSHDGTYITHPDLRRVKKGNFFVHVKDASETGLADSIVNEIKERKTSDGETYKCVLVNRKESYMFYSPITGTDWMQVLTVPSLELDMIGIIVGIVILFCIIVVLIATFLVCYLTIRRTANPLKQLANAADRVAQGEFDTLLPIIKQRDEICQLRDSFENMQHSLTEYIENLKATTSEKASIENELKIAHGIQMSMLPKTYPAFPNRNDIDLFGQVTPAKAVGGDLYDFFIRDEKLFFCIGDVSGKGVPASLVMAVTRSLFRNIAAHTSEPQKMVMGINESLSESNETSMFVTLFVGVLDLATGSLDYCNAGHDMPLLLADGEVSELSCDPNMPAGVMPGWEFTRQQTQLKRGTTIFLYTDGLNEAEDISHQQFGMERVTATAKVAGNSPQTLIAAMSAAVAQFVGDAEQSDDLTMFAIQKK